jgi:hypothetical protein
LPHEAISEAATDQRIDVGQPGNFLEAEFNAAREIALLSMVD